MKGENRPFLSTAFFTVIGRSGGLLIPFCIAWLFGVSSATDAFFMTFGFTFLFVETFTHLLEAFAVPRLAEHKSNGQRLSEFSSGITCYAFIGAIGCCLFGWIFLRYFLASLSGFNQEFTRNTAQIFMEMSPVLILGAWIASWNGFCYSYKVFWYPAISPLLRSLWVLGMLWFAHANLGIHAASWGFGIGEILRWGVTLVLVRRLTPWKLTLNWSSAQPQIRAFFHHGIFQVLALLIFNLFMVTDQWFASWLGHGNLSLLSYADRLAFIPFYFFLTGFLHVFHSSWADSYVNDPENTFWNKIGKDIRTVLLISLMLCLFCWGFKDWIVQISYGREGMLGDQIAVIRRLFGWYILGLIPGVINLLYVRVLFIIQTSRFYFFYAVTQLMVNILLNLLLMPHFHADGIAMATTLTYWLSALWLGVDLRRRRLKLTEKTRA